MEKYGIAFQITVSEKWDKFDEPVELAVYSIDRKQCASHNRAVSSH